MSDTAALLDALRSVPGVASADIEPDDRPEGAGTLRLQLAPGVDEVAVATSVNRVLREQFGLAVDANRVQVIEESVPGRPAVGPAPSDQPDQPDQPGDAGEAADRGADDGAASPPSARPTLTAVPGYLGAAPGPAARPGGGADVGPGRSGVEAPADQDASSDQGDRLGDAAAATGTSVSSVTTSHEGDAGSQSMPDRRPRILIQKMQLVSAGLGVTTEVTLVWQGEPFAGAASAAATPTSVHRSVAQATLRAVEAVVGGRARFELEQLEINQLGPDRAVVVVVSMLTRVGSERLTGVSVVREDVRQAVIRATLDALNRRLESLLLIA